MPSHTTHKAATAAAVVMPPAATTGPQGQAQQQQQRALPSPSFLGRTFYLDIRSSPDMRNQIKFGIEALKGTIENFLSSEVKYVVTDRPRETWPGSKESPPTGQTGTPAPPSAGPSPAKGSAPPFVPAPMSKDVMSKAVMQRLSRARLMMDKASATNPGIQQQMQSSQLLLLNTSTPSNTTDVLKTAERLGVKIIAASRMMEFLMENVQLPGVQRRDPSPTAMKSVKAIPILGSFIKVEAADQRTRPIAKVFRTWPDLVLEPGTGCPFRLTHVSPQIAERMKQEQQQRQQQQKQQQKDINQTPVPSPMPSPVTTNIRSTPKDLRHNRIIAGGGRRTTAIASWSRITPQPADSGTPIQSNHAGNTANAKQNLVTRHQQQQAQLQQGIKRKAMFCEVCGVDFEHLNDHVRSHTHERFLKDPDNFKELVSVISSLPKLSDLEAASIPVVTIEDKENTRRKTKDKRKSAATSKPEESMEEEEGTSAYDVTHLREKMSGARIAATILSDHHDAPSLDNDLEL